MNRSKIRKYQSFIRNILGKQAFRFAILLVGSVTVLTNIAPGFAAAATLNQVFVRFDRMQISTTTTGTVCAKATTASVEASVVVGFPTGYVLGAAASFTVNTTNLAWPSGGTAWPGVGTATNVTGQNVTFPSGDLVVGTLYCFNWTTAAAVTVKSTATSSNLGTVTTQTSVPAAIDTAQFATASITNDQIVVSATVPPAFSFALSGNTDPLGTLSTAAITSSPTPRTATVNTNAKNGWLVWAKDASGSLSSASSGDAINTNCSAGAGTNSTLVAGGDGYNTGVTSTQVGGSGVITVAPVFVGGVAGKGGGLCGTNLQSIASSTGTANTAVLTLTNNITIDPTQAAATDYTDTITVVAAGLF